MGEGSIKVLVVDDEEKIVKYLSMDIDDEGFETIHAFNGEDAFDLVAREQPQVVVTDVRMPGGSGVELLDKIKLKNLEVPQVFFITGFSDISPENAYAKGVNQIFRKPIESQEIIRSVKTALIPLKEKWQKKPTGELPELRIDRASLPDQLRDGGFAIGRGGCFIGGGGLEQVQVGKLIRLTITFMVGDPALFQSYGTVRWTRTGRSNQTEALGFEFQYLDGASRDYVLEHITEKNPVAYIPNGG